MRILHITNTLSEGGVESLLLQLLPPIVAEGYEVDILVLNKNKTALHAEFEKRGIHVFSGPAGTPYNPLNIALIRQYIKRYDIIHVHLWPAQLWTAVASLVKKHFSCYVTTEHGNFNKRRMYTFYRPVEEWMYSRYHTVVCVSETSRNNLLQWIRNSHHNVISIPNGIDLSQFSEVTPYTKKELNLPENAIVVIMVARFFPAKDHLTLIRAMAYTPVNVHLLLVGSGDTMAGCKKEMQKLNLSGRVHFLGRRSDVPKIIISSDICVLSTNNEGLPLSVLEYMGAGRPVIVTDVEGMRELISEQWVVAPHNAEELGRKITKLAENKLLRESVGNSNRRKAAKHELHEMIDKYIMVYRSF